jgi:hypothetical protein
MLVVSTVPFNTILLPQEFNMQHSWDDVLALAESILIRGLFGPIGTAFTSDRGFHLVEGFRRFLAMEFLIARRNYVPEQPGGRLIPAAQAFALVPVLLCENIQPSRFQL